MPQFKTRGFKQLERAIERNPKKVRREVGDFFVDVMRIYNTGIIRHPWRIGGRGGGAPVDTGNLRDRHIRKISTWQARIYVDRGVDYAEAVHYGTKHMEARPWLDYVFDSKWNDVKKREKELYDNIIKDLAR